MDLTVWTTVAETTTLIAPVGDVDVYTSPQLREHLLAVAEAEPQELLVDLRRVDFIDSTGLGVLVIALKRQNAHGGKFGIVCDSPTVLKTLSLTGLDKVFSVHADLPESITLGSEEPTKHQLV